MSFWFIGHPSEQDLALFAGGELGPLSRWRIERHLETCAACERSVADFFHLRDELSPLGELPSVDWSRMAREIEARVAAEAPLSEKPTRSWGPQVALAAACAAAIVAVAVRSPVAKLAAPQLETAAQLASAPEAELLEQVEADSVAPPAPVDQLALLATKEEASLSEPAGLRANRLASPAEQKVSAPLLGFADEADAEGTPRREMEESFAAEPAAEKADLRADADSFRARASSRASAVSMDLPATSEVRQRSPLEARVLPPLGAEARLTLDGVYEIRAMSAEGVFTITEVYAQ